VASTVATELMAQAAAWAPSIPNIPHRVETAQTAATAPMARMEAQEGTDRRFRCASPFDREAIPCCRLGFCRKAIGRGSILSIPREVR
jgi:hypothetical protein